MTDSFVISSGDTVTVSYDPSDWVTVEIADPPSVGVVTVEGPQGPPGPSGPAFEGVAWFTGEGPPATILGAKPGDYYINTIDGTIFRLGD